MNKNRALAGKSNLFVAGVWSAITLLVSLTFTFMGVWILQEQNKHHLDHTIDDIFDQTINRLTERISIYVYGLRGARGVILTAGEHGITRDLFLRYSKTREFEKEFKGARGMGFIRRVPRREESAFLVRARSDGKPDFAIRELNPHAGDRYIIEYIEPYERNAQAVGLDIASEQQRRDAADAAMRDGTPHLTGPITLVQASNNKSQSFLLLLPIYRTAITPVTIDERERELIGWSYAPLLMSEVLSTLMPPSDTWLNFSDITLNDTPVVIHDSENSKPTDSIRKKSPSMFGRKWLVTFGASPEFIRRTALYRTHVYIPIGVLVSGLLATLAGFAGVGIAQRRQIREKQAHLATIVENSVDGIISQNLQGVVTSWNTGAMNLFGFSAEEAVGKKIMDLIVPHSRQGEDPEFISRIQHGETLQGIETRRCHKDGHEIEVAVTISPLTDSQGKIIGASKSLRDITVQKSAQRRVEELNVNLESLVKKRTEEMAHVNSLLSNVLDSASAVAIIATTIDGTITIFNKGAENLLGYSTNEMVGRNTPIAIHLEKELDQRGVELFNEFGINVSGYRVLVQKPEINGSETREWTYVRKDGSEFPVMLIVTAMLNGEANLAGFLFIGIDISAQKQSEQALSASLRTTRAILETAANPIVTIDGRGIIQSINPAGLRSFGYDQEEIIGKNVSCLMPAPYRVEHDSYLERYKNTHNPRIIGIGREVTALRKDGSCFPIQLAVGAINDEQTCFVGIMTDLTVFHQQQQQLINLSNQLKVAVEVAELGIWTWTLADNSLLWNDKMYEIYQQSSSLRETGLRYSHWHERIHPEDVDAVAAELNEAVETGGVYDSIYRVARPDGSIRVVQAGAYVRRDNQGTPTEVIGFNRDVTVQKELETSLLQAKQLADEANAAKSNFLANMSHEIRTPLNASLGMLQLLQKTDLNKRQADYVDKAHEASKSLLGLLNDILDYSKIEAGKLELDEHPFSIETLMHELATILSGNAATKQQVEVVFDVDTDLPETLFGDSLRIKQILINLAGNALKFTHQGSVVVAVKALDITARKVNVRFSVVDTGIGISEEQQTIVFEGFTQAEASISRRYGGTGLGLVISKRLASLMGGELKVESQAGVGSHFWFDVPLLLVPEAERTLRESITTAAVKPHVLVVDDNTLTGEIIVNLIQQLGWQADYASGGYQALDKANAAFQTGTAFNVVLMDWLMPDLNGLETAALMRDAHQAFPPVIIMITAHGREVLSNIVAPKAPFFDFLVKPVTPQLLANTIYKALGNTPEPSPLPLRQPTRRLVGLKILVVEDNPINRQVISDMLASEGADVILAENGIEGVAQVNKFTDTLDLVFMDMQMPEMDGLEATRRIRSDPRFLALPILAMTANASIADKNACKAAGMNEHLSKPIDFDEVINCALKFTDKDTKNSPTALAPRAPLDEASLIEEKSSILRRFGGKEQIIKVALPQFPSEIDTLLSNLQISIDGSNKNTAIAELHTIKGSAATMGASRLALLAAQYETFLRTDTSEHPLDKLKEKQTVIELRIAANLCYDALASTFSIEHVSVETPKMEEAPWVLPSDQEILPLLQKLLELLDTSNLHAMESVRALSALGMGGKQWRQLAQQVDVLQFEDAKAILIELLNSMNKNE